MSIKQIERIREETLKELWREKNLDQNQAKKSRLVESIAKKTCKIVWSNLDEGLQVLKIDRSIIPIKYGADFTRETCFMS